LQFLDLVLRVRILVSVFHRTSWCRRGVELTISRGILFKDRLASLAASPDDVGATVLGFIIPDGSNVVGIRPGNRA